jgi:hypothetical protein
MVPNGPEYRIPFVKGIETVAVMEFLKNPTLNSKKFDFKMATLSQYFKSSHEYKEPYRIRPYNGPLLGRYA